MSTGCINYHLLPSGNFKKRYPKGELLACTLNKIEHVLYIRPHDSGITDQNMQNSAMIKNSSAAWPIKT